MSDSNINRKDEILKSIVNLERSIEDKTIQWKEKTEEVEESQKVYNKLKSLLDEKARELNALKSDISSITRQGKDDRFTLDSLKRELSRILDAERVHQEFLEQAEIFREKCLETPWRKENRDDGLGAKTHQIDGAIQLAVSKTALLGDKRGLGKTLTALIWCDLIEAKKVIAVVPPDTMNNFIREVRLWTPHRRVIKLGKMDKGTRDFILSNIREVPEFLIVLNYEAWRKDKDLIDDLIALKADTLIEDEAHHAKTLDTVTCQGITDLRFGFNECPHCNHPRVKLDSDKIYAKCACGYEAVLTEFCSIKNVLPMTGTPILNKPQELYPHLRLIDPVNFSTEINYLRDFCYKSSNNRWRWGYDGEKRIFKVIGHRYIARDRKSAGVVIPPPTPVDHYITMDELEEKYPKQHRAYMQARNYAQIVLDPDRQIAMSMPVFITVLLRLRQVLIWPNSIELKVTNPDTSEQEVLAKLDVYESAKLDKAEEIIREIIEEGDRVVLFSQFKPGLHELKRRLGMRVAVYDGDTSEYQRNRIALDFDVKTVGENPQYDAVLCNYKSAGEGLNFQAASHMILLDREWNPGKEEQAGGRIDRMGQTKETTIHKIHVEQSVDAWMDTLIKEKKNMIEGFEDQANLFRSAYDALRKGEM